MLAYVTADEPQQRKPRPSGSIPETLNRFYDLAMREHDRRAVLAFGEGKDYAEDPDWRFDRDVIRVALFCQERLKVKAGERVALLGAWSPLWLHAEFGLLGLGVSVVGLDPALSDEQVASALSAAGVRFAVATDAPSAGRLLGSRFRAPSLKVVLAPETGGFDGSVVPLAQLREFGATLDTPERANRFREVARGLEPSHPALWHFESRPGGGVASRQLTQGEAMGLVRGQLTRLAARAGDLVLLDTSAVTLAARIGVHAWTGDGYTTIALAAPRELGAVAGQVRPTGLVARTEGMAGLARELCPEPAGGLERLASAVPGLRPLAARRRLLRLRRALDGRTGGRLRFVMPQGPLPAEAGEGFAFVTTLVAPVSTS
jgi:hypothetical protein